MNEFNYACTYAYVHGVSAMKSLGRRFKERVEEVKRDESGMEVIAVVLILVVVIALVVVFRHKIVDIFTTLWDKIFDNLNEEDNETKFSNDDTVSRNYVRLFNLM